MAKKTDAVTTATKDVTWPRIYVGPSIPKGYFKANMVFADGLSTVAQALVEKHPELNTALSEVNKAGSRLHGAYEKALLNKGE